MWICVCVSWDCVAQQSPDGWVAVGPLPFSCCFSFTRSHWPEVKRIRGNKREYCCWSVSLSHFWGLCDWIEPSLKFCKTSTIALVILFAFGYNDLRRKSLFWCKEHPCAGLSVCFNLVRLYEWVVAVCMNGWSNWTLLELCLSALIYLNCVNWHSPDGEAESLLFLSCAFLFLRMPEWWWLVWVKESCSQSVFPKFFRLWVWGEPRWVDWSWLLYSWC